MEQDSEIGAAIAEDGDGEAQAAFPWRPDSAQSRARRARPPGTKTLTEFDLHKAVAQYLDWCLAPPAFYTTFPAGWDKMSKTRAGMLYAAGLKAGIPDILIFYNGRTIALELKAAKGRLSRIQQSTILLLEAAGVIVQVCKSVDEVETGMRLHGLPLRGTVRAA
jgi:hypothetical protein